MPPIDDPLLRLRAGDGPLAIAGLVGSERETVRAAWSRCDPQDLPAGITGADLDRADHGDWDAFHEAVVYEATSRAIEAGRGTRLMLHAACLAAPTTGAAIALVAASGTGKTTATRVLGPHFAYLTDETAIVDPDTLAVTPYAKPLSVLGPTGARPKAQVGPDALGLGATLAEGHLARIAVLDRVRDPQRPVQAQAETMSLLDALQALVPQTSSLSRLDRGLVTLCRTLDRLGGAQRLVYAEAGELRPVVEALLRDDPAPLTPTWEPLRADEIGASADSRGTAAAGPEALRRRAADDGVVLDDGTLVLLVDTRLLVLEGLGPVLWLLLSTPRTRTELLACLAELGPLPPDADEQVRRALEALREHGVVDGGS